MRITALKTKRRVTFRNKIQTQKIYKYDHTIIRPKKPLWLNGNNTQSMFSPSCKFKLIRWPQKKKKKPLVNHFFLAREDKRSSKDIYLNLASRAAIVVNCYSTGWCPENASKSPSALKKESNFNFVNASKSAHSYMNFSYTNPLLFGQYGIIFQNHGLIQAKRIETIRLDIAKQLRKKAKVWLRVCCDTPVTSRPALTRMGKGKGAISYYQVKVKPGQVFFEFGNLDLTTMQQLLQNISKKSGLPLKLVATKTV